MRTARYYLDKARVNLATATFAGISPNAQRARDDFAYFCEYVANKPPAKHHLEWITALVTGQSNACLNLIAGPNLEILAPRGSAKSTVIAMFVSWVIGHNPDISIIYVGYSENVALGRSRIIKRIVTSDKYREVFPHILPSKRWSDTDWEINKAHADVTSLDSDFTLYATGITGSITSKRAHLLIYDDLIKSSESIANPEIRERIVQNIGEVLRPTLIPGGREIDIGTRFRADDIHMTEFTQERGWMVMQQQAIVEVDGDELSYWPERFSLESLKKMREDSPVIFSFQYQNEVVRVSEISIDPNWIVRGDVPERFDMYVIGADLSSTQKETADWTVFVLLGKVFGDPRLYVIDHRRGRWPGNISKLNTLLDMCVDNNLIGCEVIDAEVHELQSLYAEEVPQTKIYSDGDQTVYFVAEAVAYQASLKGDFKDYIVKKIGLRNLVYRKPKTEGDKLSRLRGVSGLFENRLVIFNTKVQLGRIIKELTNFGSLDHDDCVDAIVYALRAMSSRTPLDGADY